MQHDKIVNRDKIFFISDCEIFANLQNKYDGTKGIIKISSGDACVLCVLCASINISASETWHLTVKYFHILVSLFWV